MALGYTMVLVLISFFRELLGGGTLMAGTPFMVTVIPEAYRIGVFNSAPGGFMVFGILAAIVQFGKYVAAEKQGKKCEEPTVHDCSACNAACGSKPADSAEKTEGGN